MSPWPVLAVLGAACAAETPAPLLVEAPGRLQVGRQPGQVAVADLDGDGDPDLVTVTAGSKGMAVLLGDGKGSFARARKIRLGGEVPPDRLALGDLDGDGRTDAVIGSHDSNSVRIFLGDGAGGFREAEGSPVEVVSGVSAHNHGVALADLSADGRLDLLTANHDASSVSVLLGDGRGGFRPAPGSQFATGRGPYRLPVADFDRDGRLDVATPDVGGNSVTVFRGGADGSLSPAPGSPIPVDPRPFFAGAGDVQGDGWPDLVLSHDDSEELTLLLGGESGFSRQASRKVRVGARAGEVVIADLDGDGKADLVTGTASHQVVVLLGDGRGGFQPAPGSPFATGRGPWSLAVADLNGDGRLDVVTANSESDDLTLLFGR